MEPPSRANPSRNCSSTATDWSGKGPRSKGRGFLVESISFAVFSREGYTIGMEEIPMTTISEKIAKLINDQINAELYSA